MIGFFMTVLEALTVIFMTALLYFIIWCTGDIFRVMCLDWKLYPSATFKVKRMSVWFLGFLISFGVMRMNGAFISHYFF